MNSGTVRGSMRVLAAVGSTAAATRNEHQAPIPAGRDSAVGHAPAGLPQPAGTVFDHLAMAHLYGRLRRAAPPQTHRQIGEPNTESEPSTIERAAAEPEHGTGQPDACEPEAFLAPLFGRCVHISQNVAGD
jgi:hypothetical protein